MLLERKYGWKGICIENADQELSVEVPQKNIDYLSIDSAGAIDKVDFDKYTFGCVSVSKVDDELKERMVAKGFICAGLSNGGAIFYNAVAHFNGTYYFNKNKSYPHEVTFNPADGTIKVTSDFPWKEDMGIINPETLVVQFGKLCRRTISADMITLHSTDKWYKM